MLTLELYSYDFMSSKGFIVLYILLSKLEKGGNIHKRN